MNTRTLILEIFHRMRGPLPPGSIQFTRALYILGVTIVAAGGLLLIAETIKAG